MKGFNDSSEPDSRSSRLSSSFDYRRFLARRQQLSNVIWGFCAAWWATLFLVGIGARWWEPLERLKYTVIWDDLTVDRLLALGAWVSVAVAIGGPWLVRNLRRPPQLFILLRDFQSRDAAQLASRYVRSHGAEWGYWLTLENADLQAADSVSGDAEMDPDDDGDRNQKLPVGAWQFTSLALGLIATTVLLLSNLDSALLRWMRGMADHFGLIGKLVLGIVILIGMVTVWLAITLIINWLLVKVQRTAVLPGQINSLETFQKVLDTIVSRVRRRATTLTLGPLPVISVGDRWWKDAVLRSIAEARLVVFLTTERYSDALNWEMDQVRQLFDPHRTLYIKLFGNDLQLTNGNGDPIPGTSSGLMEERIETAVSSMLLGDGVPQH